MKKADMRLTLLTDGSSDRALMPILRWLVGQHASVPFELMWADLRKLPRPPRDLAQRIEVAVELYPCELLFVHRDAERQPREQRVTEIHAALKHSSLAMPAVCVIPIRMQEAWLLFNPPALRSAAGCPRGRMQLQLPAPRRIEAEPDPKQLLHELLRTASGLTGRRAKRFRPDEAAHRLAELIDDFAPLRQLSAFQALEHELTAALAQMGCLARS